jgi:D-alanyl-D-alanine carboxypeptidase/D-alanyl-D-alanine-endopeptidase (penicillin-binding protein 4)
MSAPAYAFGVFSTLWRQWGGTLEGGYRVEPKGKNARPLLTWNSRHLGEIVRPLNKWSNNVMTRMLLYSMAEPTNRPPLTRAQGAQAMLDHLTRRGLDPTGLVIDNGSGLSRITRVTARFMGRLMRFAWHEPTMPEYLASLSIVGQDGTARKRFKDGPERGRMHLKTGSIADVSAVGGYVHTPAGRTFVVTVLINHRGANWGIGTAVQDAVLRWTFGQQ